MSHFLPHILIAKSIEQVFVVNLCECVHEFLQIIEFSRHLCDTSAIPMDGKHAVEGSMAAGWSMTSATYDGSQKHETEAINKQYLEIQCIVFLVAIRFYV